MDIASDVVELFTTRQPQRAQELAEKLERLNTDRREAEASILTQIEERLKDPAFEQARCIVMDGEGWHRGIIGILASRIVDQTGKPALVITHEEAAHGSGRSIPDFHLLNAIETCHDLFTRFGGHAHAVGFSLPSSAVPELRQRLETYARANLAEDKLGSPLTIHASLPLDRITPALFTWLRRMEPCGMGNEEPVFAAQNVRVAAAATLHQRQTRPPATGTRPASDHLPRHRLALGRTHPHDEHRAGQHPPPRLQTQRKRPPRIRRTGTGNLRHRKRPLNRFRPPQFPKRVVILSEVEGPAPKVRGLAQQDEKRSQKAANCRCPILAPRCWAPNSQLQMSPL